MDFGTSPTDSTASVEINDALFCEHGKEVCEPCGFDGREDNDAVMGYDPAPRAPLDIPSYYRNAKDQQIVCKAHANVDCKQCFNWKKQASIQSPHLISKLHKEGKKMAKANKKPESNW
ncbi:uncharacterized protein EHS24_000162 [Apiotrichum porosum]|uniref:Uncharacterized protein n=1 Tax=Apiotrichum porosum TaxID=105984 RepID=A0A427Y945_9TREE|nr:uncharacterized protein EHS24_000162 [Apiotrichum porosum]RSH87649.1 hypothetical protein EHS24_000162 [Apiotrichum porosum]